MIFPKLKISLNALPKVNLQTETIPLKEIQCIHIKKLKSVLSTKRKEIEISIPKQKLNYI